MPFILVEIGEEWEEPMKEMIEVTEEELKEIELLYSKEMYYEADEIMTHKIQEDHYGPFPIQDYEVYDKR